MNVKRIQHPVITYMKKYICFSNYDAIKSLSLLLPEVSCECCHTVGLSIIGFTALFNMLKGVSFHLMLSWLNWPFLSFLARLNSSQSLVNRLTLISWCAFIVSLSWLSLITLKHRKAQPVNFQGNEANPNSIQEKRI